MMVLELSFVKGLCVSFTFISADAPYHRQRRADCQISNATKISLGSSSLGLPGLHTRFFFSDRNGYLILFCLRRWNFKYYGEHLELTWKHNNGFYTCTLLALKYCIAIDTSACHLLLFFFFISTTTT
jgi:hypothetical protein